SRRRSPDSPAGSRRRGSSSVPKTAPTSLVRFDFVPSPSWHAYRFGSYPSFLNELSRWQAADLAQCGHDHQGRGSGDLQVTLGKIASIAGRADVRTCAVA